MIVYGNNLKLYSGNKSNKKPKTKTGFANKSIAIKTLKNIKSFPINYQKQVVITMFNRAKYHPNQTENMRSAMKIYSLWLRKNNIKTYSKKK